MKLTGKCKEDFEKDCIDNEMFFSMSTSGYLLYCGISFWDISNSFKFGVIQDFADSVGIRLEAVYGNGNFSPRVDSLFCRSQKSRLEARTEAVKQFNKIYNKQNG